MPRLRVLFLPILTLWAMSCACAVVNDAIDMGTVGPVYPIAEEDWLVWVKRRLSAMEKSGEIARRMEEDKRQALASIENPQPLPGIGPTVEAKTWWYDPSIVVTENVVDGQGRIVVAAGTRRNPLEVVALSKRLVFFDARDAKQVAFAKALANEGAIKPILVAGSWLDLMRQWKTRIYFDQGGILTAKFGITQVPAVIVQDGDRLRIEEVKL